MNIQWFPGHMAKSFRDIENNLKKIDLFLCVLDARAPYSCINHELERKIKDKPIVYLINKVDLADKKIVDQWIKYFESRGKVVSVVDALKQSAKQVVISCINKALEKKFEKQKEKNIVLKTRVAIVGVPNTGKSTLLNTLAGSYLSKTGNKAGVTVASSWVKLKNNIELMDNAGTLYPKFLNDRIAENLAFVGSVSTNALDETELAFCLIDRLKKDFRGQFFEKYAIKDIEIEDEQTTETEAIFEQIARKKGCIMRGNMVDYERTSRAIVDDFQSAKIGKFCLETPKEDYVK